MLPRLQLWESADVHGPATDAAAALLRSITLSIDIKLNCQHHYEYEDHNYCYCCYYLLLFVRFVVALGSASTLSMPPFANLVFRQRQKNPRCNRSLFQSLFRYYAMDSAVTTTKSKSNNNSTQTILNSRAWKPCPEEIVGTKSSSNTFRTQDNQLLYLS